MNNGCKNSGPIAVNINAWNRSNTEAGGRKLRDVT